MLHVHALQLRKVQGKEVRRYRLGVVRQSKWSAPDLSVHTKPLRCACACVAPHAFLCLRGGPVMVQGTTHAPLLLPVHSVCSSCVCAVVGGHSTHGLYLHGHVCTMKAILWSPSPSHSPSLPSLPLPSPPFPSPSFPSPFPSPSPSPFVYS